MMGGVQSQLKKQQILWSLLSSLPSLRRWYKCHLINGGWYGIGRLYAWNSIIYCIVNHAASKIMSSHEMRNHLIPIFILRNECSGQSQRGKGLFPSTKGSYMSQRCGEFPICPFDCFPNWLLMTPSFSRRLPWEELRTMALFLQSALFPYPFLAAWGAYVSFLTSPNQTPIPCTFMWQGNLTLMKWGGAKLFLVGHAAQW